MDINLRKLLLEKPVRDKEMSEDGAVDSNSEYQSNQSGSPSLVASSVNEESLDPFGIEDLLKSDSEAGDKEGDEEEEDRVADKREEDKPSPDSVDPQTATTAEQTLKDSLGEGSVQAAVVMTETQDDIVVMMLCDEPMVAVKLPTPEGLPLSYGPPTTVAVKLPAPDGLPVSYGPDNPPHDSIKNGMTCAAIPCVPMSLWFIKHPCTHVRKVAPKVVLFGCGKCRHAAIGCRTCNPARFIGTPTQGRKAPTKKKKPAVARATMKKPAAASSASTRRATKRTASAACLDVELPSDKDE